MPALPRPPAAVCTRVGGRLGTAREANPPPSSREGVARGCGKTPRPDTHPPSRGDDGGGDDCGGGAAMQPAPELVPLFLLHFLVVLEKNTYRALRPSLLWG